MDKVRCDKCGKQGKFMKTIGCYYRSCRKRLHLKCASVRIPQKYGLHKMATVCNKHMSWHVAMSYAQETFESLGGKVNRDEDMLNISYPGMKFNMTILTDDNKYQWRLSGLGKNLQDINPAQPHDKLFLDLKKRLKAACKMRRDDAKKRLERCDKAMILIEGN